MKWILNTSLALLLSFSSQSETLFDTLYKKTKSEDQSVVSTTFYIISNIQLDDKNIKTIINDYNNENDPLERFFYELTLAKRTQEDKYNLLFIESSRHQLDFLLSNKTEYISIQNPYYDHLETLSFTHEKALEVILSLYLKSDSSLRSIISEHLKEYQKNNLDKFLVVLKKHPNKGKIESFLNQDGEDNE